MKNWLIERFTEKSTYDGLMFTGLCVAIVLFGDIAQLLAMVGIVVGVYAMVRKD